MKKSDVMSALLSVDANVPMDVISFIGQNLPEKDSYIEPFDHDKPDVFEACGVTKQDLVEMHRCVCNYMMELPDGESRKSKGIEFIVNSGNRNWLILCAMAGFDKISDSIEKFSIKEVSERIAKEIEKRLRKDLEDED